MKHILFIIPFVLLLTACGGSTTESGDGGTTTEPTFDYTKDPFKANLYYGRSLLTTDNERNAYDLIMKTLLEFEVNESNKNNARIGVNFIENNINITYNQLLNIMKYVLYDEQRLTYLITSSVPRGMPTGSPSKPTESNGFVVEAYFDVMGNMLSTARQIYDTNTPKIEDGVVKILSKLSNDMTEAQKFRVLHDAM